VIQVPSLHITATEDVIRIPGYYSAPPTGWRCSTPWARPAKTLAVFEGGSHSMFTDRAGTGGATLNPQVKAATQELSTGLPGQRVRAATTGRCGRWPALSPGIAGALQPSPRIC
jgi:hypothetical protein